MTQPQADGSVVSAVSRVQIQLSSDQFVTIALALIFGIVACWTIFLYMLRNQPEILKNTFNDGFVLRMLTIAFIVASVAMLTVGGMADNQTISVLSGIAGFVLGGVHKRSTQ